MKAWVIAAAALLLGFVAGFVARPLFAPVGSAPLPTTASSAELSENDAQAAVRRFGRDASTRLPLAVMQLGACEPSKIAAGLECAVTLVPRPGAAPQRKQIGFAKFGERWERTY